jgi:hypothetical protein
MAVMALQAVVAVEMVLLVGKASMKHLEMMVVMA